MYKNENRHTKQQKAHRFEYVKKIIVPITIIIGLAALAVWFVISLPSLPEDQIIAKQGIHWHPELAIYIKGQRQEIPVNVGLGVVHNPIHTHDDTGVIHLEFSGLVSENNIRLGKFFRIWNKQFSKDCIFESCNGPDGQVKMLVNGEENTEFESYIMRDKDKIEIKYE